MIGQAHVTEPLMTALRTGRIGHAYLFSGPRGCGKTTSARILARCLNCAEGPTDTPCGTCPSCVELSRDGGGSLDVVEIDAASHGGVDDARELRERAVFAPARDRFKIFIIDEAHMVTSGGFNALLKIVEEPPPHVKFIFATTEPEKVIGTIRSRTHHYPFRLIAPGALIDYVQQLCDSEGVQVEPGVLALVVRSGGGSVRDTLSILDQLIAGSEGTSVTLERATGLLGFTSTELIDEVVQALGSGDSAAAFAATDRVVQTGQDPRRFVEDLLERLRDLIVISATSVEGASAVFRGVPDDQLERMFNQSQVFSYGQLSRIADVVSGTLDTMVGATAPRLHLELMVARALLATGVAPAVAAAVASSTPSAPSAAAPAAVPQPPVSSAPSASRVVEPSPVSTSAARPETSMPASVQPAAPATTPAPAAPAPSADAIDLIATMKSARDFLKNDESGATRPPMVPLGGGAKPAAEPSSQAEPASPAPREAEAPRTQQAVPTQVEASSAPGAAAPEAVALDEMLETWPDLLDELLENDREAWNAVRQAQPLAIEGEMLTIGFASKADLDAFKASGAGPLREALVGAFGISVKYMPRPLPEGVRPMFANREGNDEAPQEPFLTAETLAPPPSNPAEQPASIEADSVDSAPESSPPERPSLAEMSDPPAPPSGDYTEPDYEPEPEPGYEPEPEPTFERWQTTTPVSAATPEPEPVREPEPVPGPEPAAMPELQQKPASLTEEPKRRESPGFTRYGESVVREVLGARFVEERPLPEGFER